MSACAGKRRYPSRVDALLDLARIQRRDDSDREVLPVRGYRCGGCRGWHLTSMPLGDAAARVEANTAEANRKAAPEEEES